VSQRNLVYEALVLRAKESPGGSRILTLMTAESGLVDVFIFGGPKSKLRSLASPYAAGRAFVYLDPIKDFQKLSDYDVRDSFPALREDLNKLWGAGLVAELLIRTSGGGGDFPLVLELSLEALGALDRAESGKCDGPILVFIWRLVNLLGLGPDPSACSGCGAQLRPSQGGAYSFSQEGFLCPDCAAHADRCLELGTGSLRWLARSLELPYAEAATLPLLTETIETLKALLFALARKAAEGRLASLESGNLSL
jgi:DNA repair protein RecO (recombination protein O)